MASPSVAYVGGTAIPFNDSAAYYDGYIASSKKMAKAAADYGATVLMSDRTKVMEEWPTHHSRLKRIALHGQAEKRPFLF